MKKTFLAFALAGLYVASANAQSNVQLYGVVDMGVAHYSNGITTVNNISQGGLSNSRIGVKGSEDLGGGLSAIFQAESGFCGNGGYGGALSSGGYCSGGLFMGRQSWVGLKGGFGQFTMGRQYTYSDDDLFDFDPFTDNTLGGNGNLIEGGPSAIPVRVSQMVEYDTPNFSGFDVGAQYIFGDGIGLTTTTNGQTSSQTTGGYALRGRYQTGGLKLSALYYRQNDQSGKATIKDTQIAGAYDFGVARVYGIYGQNKPDSSVVSAKLPEKKWYMLGVSVPVGPGSILAAYTHAKNDTQTDANANQYALGYLYSLSKRTTIYTVYSRIANGANANYAIGVGNTLSQSNGYNSSGFMLGMKHAF